MGREILIVWAGRRQQGTWQRLCDDYRKRAGRWAEIRELPVKVKSASDDASRLAAEGAALLAALPDPCWIVTLDSRGKARTSTELASWLERRIEEWPHPIAFLVGSDLGLAPQVRAAAREILSFGPATLPHQLAKLVLYEQLYRALSIGAGIKYHRGPL
jgi:23S rRNA (pseudouridine1915-N3)-methyltransferase